MIQFDSISIRFDLIQFDEIKIEKKNINIVVLNINILFILLFIIKKRRYVFQLQTILVLKITKKSSLESQFQSQKNFQHRRMHKNLNFY